jgi:sigma-B regulation protein RsbQ
MATDFQLPMELSRRCRMHRVTARGQTGPLLVLMHGFGTDQDIWRHVLPGLIDRFRIITYDLAGAGPNAGMTFDPLRHADIEAHADDLLLILGELGITRCYYVGASLGAMIGALAAIERPALFRRLILLGGSPRYLNDDGYVGGFDQPSIDGLYQAMSGNYHEWVSGFAPLVVRGSSDATHEFAESLMALRPDLALSMAKAIFQSDLRDRMPYVKVPTTILQMRSDIAVPVEVGQYLNTHIVGSTMEVIAAEGHFPHISAPAIVIDALRRHLQEN